MKYLILILSALTISCSTTDETLTEQTFSEETNRAFLEIERGGNSYLRKREKKIALPQIKTVLPKKNNSQRPITNHHKDEIQISQLKGPHQERLAEINQNLAFYCMKHRKNKSFKGDEKKCMNFVNETLVHCQKTNKKADAKLLLCINEKLKNRP